MKLTEIYCLKKKIKPPHTGDCFPGTLHFDPAIPPCSTSTPSSPLPLDPSVLLLPWLDWAAWPQKFWIFFFCEVRSRPYQRPPSFVLTPLLSKREPCYAYHTFSYYKSPLHMDNLQTTYFITWVLMRNIFLESPVEKGVIKREVVDMD